MDSICRGSEQDKVCCSGEQDKVCCSGEQETFKLGIHLTLFGLAVTCGLYAATAWLGRRETHLAVNAVSYAAIAAFEVGQIKRHVEALCGI